MTNITDNANGPADESRLFSLAQQHNMEGRLHQAEAAYKEILRHNPGHSDSLLFLGKIEQQRGNYESAIAYIRKAINLASSEPHYYCNLALALAAAGKPEEAICAYQHATTLKPDYSEAYYSLALLEKERGNTDAAIKLLKRTIELRPDLSQPHNSMGNIFRECGLYNEAIEQFLIAIRINPNAPTSLYNLAGALKDADRVDEAVQHYRAAIGKHPGFIQAYINLAHIYTTRGDYATAISVYDQGLKAIPGASELHRNKAIALIETGRLQEAANCLGKANATNRGESSDYSDLYHSIAVHYLLQGQTNNAIEQLLSALHHNPEHYLACINLGLAYQYSGNFEAAMECLEKAHELNPNSARAVNDIGNIHKDLGNLPMAIAYYKAAIEINPDFPEALSRLMFLKRRICQWDNISNLSQRLTETLRSSKETTPPFPLLVINTTPKQQLDAATHFATKKYNYITKFRSTVLPTAYHNSGGKISIGYMSPDFRSHAVSYLTAGLFELHDRDRFEIYGYSCGPDDGSSMRRRLIEGFDHFIDIQSLSYTDAARRIHHDGINILVDLAGYTHLNRAQILALRPAPVQVNYLGYIGTTGTDFMDYIIVDPFVVPAAQQAFYTEKLVHLPECYQATDCKRVIAPNTHARRDYGLPEIGFIFCGFNNSYKLTPEIYSIWMRLLQKVPDSVLWLSKSNPFVVDNLKREARNRGVNPNRLVFAEILPSDEYLAQFRHADLFLDTIPYSAGTTASDALWAGCPVLTCPGNTFASRMAGSLLLSAGLPELVTTSIADYESLAVHLVQHRDELTSLKRRLEINRGITPLFNCARFARHLESAFEIMWDNHLTGNASSPISVPALPMSS